MCPTMIITYSDSGLGGMEKGFKTAMLAFSFFSSYEFRLSSTLTKNETGKSRGYN